MKIKIFGYELIPMEQIIECESFEFRCNNVDNWLKVKYSDGDQEYFKRLFAIKSLDEDDDWER